MIARVSSLATGDFPMTAFALPYALHVLAAVVWVGGMFFAWMVLRPAAVSALQPPERLMLWS